MPAAFNEIGVKCVTAALVESVDVQKQIEHKIPELMAEINRIGEMVSASSVRAESKYPSSEDDAPGKS